MLHFADIVLGQSGARRCTRCTRSSTDSYRDAPEIVPEIHSAVHEWGERPGPNFSFCGAEPLGHLAIFELLEVARVGGARRIRLETDARALSDLAIADRILRAGVRHLTIPLLGSTPEVHNALAGPSASLHETLAGAHAFAETAEQAGLPVHITARVPVCHHNLHDTPAIVTLAAQNDIRHVQLAIDDPDLDVRRSAPWLEAACDSGIVYATWVEVEGIPYGCAPGWELHLSSMYREIRGAKSDVCLLCPLIAVCGGAIPGASQRVLSTFEPPPDAARIAARIAMCFKPLKEVVNG